MILHKVVVGVLFNKKAFKVSSVGGALVDELISLSEVVSVKGGVPFFGQIATNTDNSNCSYTLIDNVNSNTLEINTSSCVFTRSSSGVESSLNLEKVCDEFLQFYKVIEKSLSKPAIRRIGIVGEFYTIDTGGNKAVNLLGGLTKLGVEGDSHRFTLTFNDRDKFTDGFDIDTADYWNCIYSFYNTELDSVRPVKSGFASNIDVQKYYNPARSDVSREIKLVVSRFKERRKGLKAKLIELGLLNE